MKTLENKIIDLPPFADPKKPDSDIRYSDLIEYMLDVRPQGGFVPSDLRKRNKIMDIVDASNGVITLEDAQAIDALGIHRDPLHAHPDHAVLHCEVDHVCERVQLVSTRRGRNGETGGDLVLPDTWIPAIESGVEEGREWRRDAAHVGRAAEDDGVARIERRQHLGVVPGRPSTRHRGHTRPFRMRTHHAPKSADEAACFDIERASASAANDEETGGATVGPGRPSARDREGADPSGTGAQEAVGTVDRRHPVDVELGIEEQLADRGKTNDQVNRARRGGRVGG